MRTHFVSITALMLCTLSFWPSLARAELVPIAITAEVTSVWEDFDSLEGRIKVGDLITGVYIYDSSTPDSEPWEKQGRYEHYTPPAGITLTVGGFVFMTDPCDVEFIFKIVNDLRPLSGDPHDNYEFRSENNLPLPNGFPVNYIELQLRDHSASALSSDALPTAAPVLDDWGLKQIYIRGLKRPAHFGILADLTSAALIPEPTTFALLGIGTLVLLRSRERPV